MIDAVDQATLSLRPLPYGTDVVSYPYRISINTDWDIWTEWTSYRCRGFHWCWARSVDHRTPPHWKCIRPLPGFHAAQPCKPSGRIHTPHYCNSSATLPISPANGGIHTILRACNHVTHGHSTVNHVDISTSGFTRDPLMDCRTFWLLPSNAMDFYERNRRKNMQMQKQHSCNRLLLSDQRLFIRPPAGRLVSFHLHNVAPPLPKMNRFFAYPL